LVRFRRLHLVLTGLGELQNFIVHRKNGILDANGFAVRVFDDDFALGGLGRFKLYGVRLRFFVWVWDELFASPGVRAWGTGCRPDGT
jgi:hypothetical protein